MWCCRVISGNYHINNDQLQRRTDLVLNINATRERVAAAAAAAVGQVGARAGKPINHWQQQQGVKCGSVTHECTRSRLDAGRPTR